MEEAFRQTKALLWPFRLKIWASLLFLNLMTGGFGGYSSFQIPSLSPSQSSESASVAPASVDPAPSAPPAPKQTLSDIRVKAGTFYRENRQTILILGGILGLMALLFVLLLMWLFARLKMVLVRGLVEKTFRIRDFWTETRIPGEALFRFNAAALFLLAIPLLSAAVFVGRGLIRQTLVFKADWPLLVFLGVGLALLTGIYVVVVGAANRFLPVYMVMTSCGLKDAVRQAVSGGRKKIIERLGYLFLYILLAVGVGIAASLIAVVAVLILLVLWGAIVLAGGLLLNFFSVPKVGLVIIGMILAMPAFMAVVVLAAVPFETFKNYVALEMVGASRTPADP